jgi:DNA polymerase IV
MFKRAILHLDLDAFFVSVECLRNDALRGKPVLIGGRSGRGVVASCSYEARRFGIHSAMPMRMALRLCPDAIVVGGDMEAYSRYSNLVGEVIADDVPLYEKASVDEFYADLTGMDQHFGCWRWSQELRDKIMRETGLPISMGLSINKLVSKVGTSESKPNGSLLVDPGTEQAFFDPLPVRRLPSVGKATHRKLSLMGIRDVHTLRQIPARLLVREFGKHGMALSQKAHAHDDRPVVPYRDQKSMSAERTFQVDTTNVFFLKQELTRMVSGLAYDLRQKQKLTSCVTLKLRYTDFNTYTKQLRIPYTASDRQLIQHAHDLLDRLFQRRQLVRLLGVRFSGLVSGRPQLDLFDDTDKDNRLLHAMDQVRKRFGKASISYG